MRLPYRWPRERVLAERKLPQLCGLRDGPQFQAGLAQLREIGGALPCAVMCAETVWWRCHRRIIADCLLAAGETVMHILGPQKIEPARMTPAARRGAKGSLSYPALQG
jgi:hypothetical protein